MDAKQDCLSTLRNSEAFLGVNINHRTKLINLGHFDIARVPHSVETYLQEKHKAARRFYGRAVCEKWLGVICIECPECGNFYFLYSDLHGILAISQFRDDEAVFTYEYDPRARDWRIVQ